MVVKCGRINNRAIVCPQSYRLHSYAVNQNRKVRISSGVDFCVLKFCSCREKADQFSKQIVTFKIGRFVRFSFISKPGKTIDVLTDEKNKSHTE